jgi:thioredoxin 1
MSQSFSELINTATPTLVDFYATWCGPCKAMAPILEQLKERLGDSLKIIKIDVDKNPALAKLLKIQGVPTMILYKNGKLLWRNSGVVSANQLIQIIQKNTNHEYIKK